MLELAGPGGIKKAYVAAVPVSFPWLHPGRSCNHSHVTVALYALRTRDGTGGRDAVQEKAQVKNFWLLKK